MKILLKTDLVALGTHVEVVDLEELTDLGTVRAGSVLHTFFSISRNSTSLQTSPLKPPTQDEFAKAYLKRRETILTFEASIFPKNILPQVGSNHQPL